MTLNEIIRYAKDHKIDFDKPVVGRLILNHIVSFDIFKCAKNYKDDLILETRLSNDFPICHVDWGYEYEGDDDEEDEK